MDQYDVAYKNLEYDYKSAKSLKFIIFRKSLYIAQILMIMGSVMVAMGVIIAENDAVNHSDQPFGTLSRQVVYVPMACAAMSFITGIIGCFGMIYIFDHYIN